MMFYGRYNDVLAYPHLIASYAVPIRQCWITKNLNIGNIISGTIDQSDNGTIEKYCYDNSIANCDTY